MSDLAARLRPFVLPVTLVEPAARGKPQIVDTKFGGAPYAEAGDEWPMCTGCGSGLTFVFQWRSEQRGLYSFYYCFECSPWGLPDEERKGWCLRRHARPGADKAVARPDRSPEEARLRERGTKLASAQSLPDWEGASIFLAQLDDLDGDEYDAIVPEVLGREPDFATQIGGYPNFVQGGEVPPCPACAGLMRLLVQIDSEEAVGLMWGDSGCVYLFECPTHRDEVSFLLQCF